MRKRAKALLLVGLLCGAVLAGWAAWYWVDRKRAFINAIIDDDPAKVRALLRIDPGLTSARDKYRKPGRGLPALHLAIRLGRVGIADLLLSKGANPNETSVEGTGPLHEAARQGNAELAETLMRYGADVNGRKGGFDRPPLAFAASRKAAEMLIKNGAEISLRGKYGDTPLHSVARWSATEVADVLLAHGADIEAKNRVGRTPLHAAAAHGRKKMAEFLIATGANVDAKDNRGLTPLNRAVAGARDGVRKADRREVAEFLLQCGAQYTIYDVVWVGDAKRVRELLTAAPTLVNDTNAPGAPFLLTAVREGHAEVVELLLAKGAELRITDRWGDPLLHLTGYYGHSRAAKALLAGGANVNRRGAYGELALHWAAARGHQQVVEVLLEAGSEIDAQTRNPRVNLDTISPQVDPVKEQLRYLARRARTQFQTIAARRMAFAAGDTPLHAAAQWGHKEIVDQLLACGAKVNVVNRWGQTPLHYACAFRQKQIVEALLNEDADVKAKDNQGRTPLSLVSSPRDDAGNAIAKLLIRQRAKRTTED